MNGPTTVVPRPASDLPRVTGAGLSHRGIVRERNEDAVLTDPGGTLWAVADGMGGYGRGDVASDIVIEALSAIDDRVPALDTLQERLAAANAEIRAQSGGRTMGATVVALMIEHAVGHVVWAGDSRAYLFRSGRLRQVTRDHTLVQDLVDRGEIDPAAAGNHPEKHIITRAVGGAEDLELDAAAVPLVPGDRLLLCSDGLTGCLTDDAIAQTLAGAETPETAVRALVNAALHAGAPDNVSAVAVFVTAGG
ncbi:MAG: protein phosphatase 2C domain-containing protein [Rhodobacteraceae bacterium]|nr:protein phosphatase 2C domain-containing protein [Paracoccaceae bacterium]